jgi:hypothetical protein
VYLNNGLSKILIIHYLDTHGRVYLHGYTLETSLFFDFFGLKSVHWDKKICFHPPNPPHPFSHCIPEPLQFS